MFIIFIIFIKANLNLKKIFDLLNKFKPSFIIGKKNIKKLNKVINVKKNESKNKNKNKNKNGIN